MQVPEWLSRRGAALQAGVQRSVAFVSFEGIPQYRLEVRPAGAAYSCFVVQAVNGRRVDDQTTTYPSPDAAFAGGLEQLRAALGW